MRAFYTGLLVVRAEGGGAHRIVMSATGRRLLALAAAALAAGPARGADGDAELRSALSALLARSALSDARAGMLVAALDGGEVVFAHRADELMNPASNVKLFTSAAALARLGPEYRFETEIWLAGGEGRGAPSLHVRGKGDPVMVTERLWALAAELQHRGLGAVREIAVDDGYFDGERVGPGFDQEQGDRAYLAPTGAVSLNFNAVAVHVAPGARAGEPARVSVEPPSDFLRIANHAVTVGPRGRRRLAVSSVALPGRQRIEVSGRLPAGGRPQVFWRKVDDPPLYFGYTLKRLLELRGMKVGRVRTGPVPEGARLVHVAESEPLADVVRRLNKTSSNFIAEQIVKALGAEARGPPGSWPKGIEALEEFLAGVGVPRGSYIMKNGSGLNDANRFSARQVVTLLREMWRRFPLMPEFASALAVAGKDGTIRWRMEGSEAAGRLRAKTGTLENVVSLSGIVESRGGRRLAFAILVNDFSARSGAEVRAVDALGAALAGAGDPGADGALAEAPAPLPQEAAAPPADVRARVATYYRIGAAGDRRNLPLLRTALRTERDPLVRLAAAEAAYLSDPDSDAARRTFLENAAAGPQALSALRPLGEPFDLPFPVASSLADLAAEGVPEALALLADAALACSADAALTADLAELWAEVADAAPAEVLAALRAAPPEASRAALSSIAAGLARAPEPGHPFLAAVEKAAGEADPELAAQGREVARRLRAGASSAEPPPGGPLAPESRPADGAEARPGGG